MTCICLWRHVFSKNIHICQQYLILMVNLFKVFWGCASFSTAEYFFFICMFLDYFFSLSFLAILSNKCWFYTKVWNFRSSKLQSKFFHKNRTMTQKNISLCFREISRGSISIHVYKYIYEYSFLFCSCTHLFFQIMFTILWKRMLCTWREAYPTRKWGSMSSRMSSSKYCDIGPVYWEDLIWHALAWWTSHHLWLT